MLEEGQREAKRISFTPVRDLALESFKQPWKAAMVPSAPAWSLRQSVCFQELARFFYLPLRKVLFYVNANASAIVGT